VRLSKVALLKFKLQQGIDTSNHFGSWDVQVGGSMPKIWEAS